MAKWYRCGWCGFPTDSKGACLEIVDYDEAAEFVASKQKELGDAGLVNGECCPGGDNTHRPTKREL